MKKFFILFLRKNLNNPKFVLYCVIFFKYHTVTNNVINYDDVSKLI